MRQSAPLFVERPAMGPSAPLSAAERQVRSEAEAAIRTGKGDPFIMGGALRTIRDGRLYRDRCVTFANYCSKEWSLRPSRAYQLMDGSRLIESLKTSTIVEVLPAREAQLRPLLRFSRKEGRERVIDFPQVARVWADVVRRAEREPDGVLSIPAKLVKDVVDEWLAAGKPDRPEERFRKLLVKVERGLRTVYRGLPRAHLPRFSEALRTIADEAER